MADAPAPKPAAAPAAAPAATPYNFKLVPMDMPPLKPEDLRSVAEQVIPPKQRKEFDESKDADFAIGVPGIAGTSDAGFSGISQDAR